VYKSERGAWEPDKVCFLEYEFIAYLTDEKLGLLVSDIDR